MSMKIKELASMQRPACKLPLLDIVPLTVPVSGKMKNTRELYTQQWPHHRLQNPPI